MRNLKSLLQYRVERMTNKLLVKMLSRLQVLESELRYSENEQLKNELGYCGKGVRFNGRIVITSPESVSIGNNVHIGDNAWIKGEGGLVIGDNTHISRNLVLYTVNHDYLGSRLPYDENLIKKPVQIGRNVWIGMNVCIAPGTVIGDGAIIGIGTVVFGKVPPLAIIGSAPWRIIGERPADHYNRLDFLKAYGGINGNPLNSENFS